MRGDTRLVRPVLAAALLLLLGALWLLPDSAAPAWRTAPALPAAARDAAADVAMGQWGDNVLARPLFNPGRRPLGETATGSDGGLPRLSAIIINGGTSAAVFAAQGQAPQVVPLGGAIGGYMVAHIAPGGVTLTGPAGSLTLRPQFAAATSSTTAPASAPGAPASPPASPLSGPKNGQVTEPVLNPSSNPALLIEQNF